MQGDPWSNEECKIRGNLIVEAVGYAGIVNNLRRDMNLAPAQSVVTWTGLLEATLLANWFHGFTSANQSGDGSSMSLRESGWL